MTTPQDGHQFHFTVHLQPSFAVIGEPYRDAAEVPPEAFRATVRAWSLADACRVAGALELKDWAHGDDVAEHTIELREDGWTIMHPLGCRPNLFACPVNRAAEFSEPLGALGTFRCTIEDGLLVLGERT